MNRRDFTKYAFAGGLCAPAIVGPGSVLAKIKTEPKSPATEFGQIILHIAAATVYAEWLLIYGGANWWGLNLAGDHRQHNENRVTIGGAVSKLLRPTIDQRLKRAQLAGAIYLVNRSLVMLPVTQRELWNLKVLVAHELLSWDPAGAPSPVTIGALTPDQVAAGYPPVGNAYILGTLLILIIYPFLGRTGS